MLKIFFSNCRKNIDLSDSGRGGWGATAPSASLSPRLVHLLWVYCHVLYQAFSTKSS